MEFSRNSSRYFPWNSSSNYSRGNCKHSYLKGFFKRCNSGRFFTEILTFFQKFFWTFLQGLFWRFSNYPLTLSDIIVEVSQEVRSIYSGILLTTYLKISLKKWKYSSFSNIFAECYFSRNYCLEFIHWYLSRNQNSFKNTCLPEIYSVFL